MTTALTPATALAYVRELSADFRAGVVLDEHCDVLAGTSELTAAATALLDAHPLARELHGATDAGHVFAARTSAHAIVVVTGRFALPRVARRDLRIALSGLGPETVQETPPERPSDPLVEALVTVAADTFSRHSAVSRSD